MRKCWRCLAKDVFLQPESVSVLKEGPVRFDRMQIDLTSVVITILLCPVTFHQTNLILVTSRVGNRRIELHPRAFFIGSIFISLLLAPLDKRG